MNTTNPENSEIVFLDIDGTLLDCQSQKLFVNYTKKRKIISTSTYLQVVIWFALYKIGLVKKPKNIMELAIRFLNGMSNSEVNALANDFYRDVLSEHFYEKIKKIISDHKKNGRQVVIVTNIFEPIAKTVAKSIHADELISTKLETEGRTYTGKISGPIVYGDTKAKLARKYLKEHSINPKSVWAYADHPSDGKLLSLAKKHAYVINPNSRMKKIAEDNSWHIISVVQ